jgi:pimeloyl-ACP methyl ester carboxylesterase
VQNLTNGWSNVDPAGAVRDGVVTVPVPGGRIAYREHGTGTPVVFLHGGTGTGAHDWGLIAAALAPRYRTIVLDLRGHGGSADHDATLGLVRFGLDLRHVLRSVGAPRAVLVGFSVGGNTLLRLLAQDPRVALALVTVGASSKGDASRVAEIMTGPWPDYLTRLDHSVGTGPEYWKDLRAALAHDWAENLALSDDDVRSVTCPTLVCHGENDRIQQLDYAHHLAAMLPDAELFLAPGAGHAVQLDVPDLFLERVEAFLSRVLLARR